MRRLAVRASCPLAPQSTEELMTDRRQQIATVDFDEAEYIGSEDDGVYVQTAEGPDGWYVSSVIDYNTARVTHAYITDDGPYASQAEALAAGLSAAKDWCVDNGVDYEPQE
jgi:hypothetical protein